MLNNRIILLFFFIATVIFTCAHSGTNLRSVAEEEVEHLSESTSNSTDNAPSSEEAGERRSLAEESGMIDLTAIREEIQVTFTTTEKPGFNNGLGENRMLPMKKEEEEETIVQDEDRLLRIQQQDEGVDENRTLQASEEPREEASEEPSEEVSEEPSEELSEEPSEELSEEPSEEVSEEPSEEVSEEPSEGSRQLGHHHWGSYSGKGKGQYHEKNKKKYEPKKGYVIGKVPSKKEGLRWPLEKKY